MPSLALGFLFLLRCRESVDGTSRRLLPRSELAVNRKTAKALGIELPPPFATADAVIE